MVNQHLFKSPVAVRSQIARSVAEKASLWAVWAMTRMNPGDTNTPWEHDKLWSVHGKMLTRSWDRNGYTAYIYIIYTYRWGKIFVDNARCRRIWMMTIVIMQTDDFSVFLAISGTKFQGHWWQGWIRQCGFVWKWGIPWYTGIPHVPMDYHVFSQLNWILRYAPCLERPMCWAMLEPRRAGGSKGKIAPKIQEPLEKGGDAVGVEKWWIYMDLYTCGTSSWNRGF